MATTDFDPFHMRKRKIPDFPSIGGTTGTLPGGFKGVQPGWELPFQNVKGAENLNTTVPDFPDAAGGQNQWGGTPIPEFPQVGNSWQNLLPGTGGARGPAGGDGDANGDGIPDAEFAKHVIGEMDAINKMLEEGVGNFDSSSADQPPDMSAQETQHEEAPATRDRSWMFQKREGWDTPRKGSGNYTPAPVTFNSTNSSDWGTTALDQRAGRTGPAASTVRYYDRAQARGQGGSKADINRIARLRLRIQGRPTNG